ncbi:MAG: response regulator transcription factor [Sutterella wadsworthensis]|nr:response regulator transcription factor [Sutterella wadsworthensis]
MPANSLSLIRVIDDDAEMRESLEFLLSTEGWKVRTYPSAKAFLDADDMMVPGCMLLDIRMPDMSGLELQEVLKKKDYALPILFITAHGDITMAVDAVKKGAFDFLPKPIDDAKLLQSVEDAVALDWELRSHHQNVDGLRKDLTTLTPREREVAELVGQGLMNKVIADRLGIAEKTVQVHRGQVCRKLKVRSAVEISHIFEAMKR